MNNNGAFTFATGQSPGDRGRAGSEQNGKNHSRNHQKQAATLLTHLSIIREGIYIIYAVNNVFTAHICKGYRIGMLDCAVTYSAVCLPKLNGMIIACCSQDNWFT